MQETDFDTLLKKEDPDRRLAALFATPQQRDGLFALYAFNHEIARIAESTSEGLIGEMKLTWWRDAVTDLYAPEPKVRRHAVTEALAGLTGRVTQDDLLGLVDARLDDIAARPFANLDDILDYVDATAGRIVRLACRICDAEDAVSETLLEAAGRAWGLTGLLRAFPMRARIGRAPAGGDALARAGATPAMMAQGLGAEKVALARQPVVEAARQACQVLKAQGSLPAPAVPALGYAVLARGYLDALPDNPYALAHQRYLLARQARLTWLSLTGR